MPSLATPSTAAAPTQVVGLNRVLTCLLLTTRHVVETRVQRWFRDFPRRVAFPGVYDGKYITIGWIGDVNCRFICLENLLCSN
jgi:hypothetical protein